MNHSLSVLAVTALMTLAAPMATQAQSSSLYGAPEMRQPLTLQNSSWVYVTREPPHEIHINDLVTVVVQEASQVKSEGEVDRRKQANLDARLRDWLELDGFGVRPAPQPNGDPRIRASLDSQYRANAEVETSGLMRFRIAATVVDIRPNGNLVLEARRTVTNNDEVWEQSLTGVVRREDVLPNNTVLSENIAELVVHKRELGNVRDGYRRGWLMKILDEYKPF